MPILRRLLEASLACVFVAGAAVKESRGDRPGDFEAIYQLVRTNLVGIDQDRFDRDAVRGLLTRMDGRVELVSANKGGETPGETPLGPVRVFEGYYGYLRVRHVEEGLSLSMQTEMGGFLRSGNLRGLMLDLRFADGADYGEAVKAVNQFVNRDETQLMLGAEPLRTVLNSNLFEGPVAILVNSSTRGAAEALAGLMRVNDVGLLIGGRTAGETKVFSRFDLRDGSFLRVATDEVRLGSGSPVSVDGISPDIKVEVSAELERSYLGDAYTRPEVSVPKRNMMNEAELVRQLRLRLNPDLAPEDAEPAGSRPREVFDPALGRALDLLKGLDLLRSRK